MTQPGDTAQPTDLARGLIRASDRAALATTLAREFATGAPYASLVLVACAPDATPLLLLSDLADHSRNIAQDARASLLFDGTAGYDDPLTGPRLSLVGRMAETADPADRARYLARHPSAKDYAAFKDFRLYRLIPTHGHLVAGFGRIHWWPAGDILYDCAQSGALALAEAEIVEHMNRDHADAIGLYARNLLGLDGANWVMTGIDPEGIDLRSGGRTARLSFSSAVHDPESARAALVRLAKEARSRH